MMFTNLALFGLGLAALALPLWVHLRLGKVKKRAVVSTLRLMRATPQTSKSPKRLVDVPLFLIRSLIVLLLALGFGRLLIPGWRGDDAREYAAIVLDVSGSMQADHGRVWDEARKAALNELGKLDRGSRAAIILSPEGLNQPVWESPAQATQRVKALSAGYGANRISTELREAARLLGEMPEDRKKVLHLIGDFQQSGFADIDQVVLPSDVDLRLTKVGPERASNRGVTVSVAAAGMTDIGLYSFHDGTGGTLELDEDGQTRSLQLSGQDVARLSHAGKKDEWITRKLTFKEEDALAADNVAYDVYQAQKEIPVWLWEPSGNLVTRNEESESPSSLRLRPRRVDVSSGPKHEYEQVSYYLNRGLQPALQDEIASASRYRPVVLTPATLAEARNVVGTADAPRLLMIPATKALPAELSELAQRLVTAGGSVILFGGPDVSPNDYHEKLGALTGVKILKSEAIAASPSLAPLTESNPLWGGLDSQLRQQLAKMALRSRHAVEVTEGTQVLARYADGAPFLTEHTVGRGRVIFVNTSADRAWSDWPASATLFVPSLHLLAARSLGNESFRPAHEPAFAGELTTVHLAPQFVGRSLVIDEARLPVNADGSVRNVWFTKPGVYDLLLDDGREAGKIAVNFPSIESTLETMPPSVMHQRLESLRQKTSGATVRWEAEPEGGLAWRLALVLAAFLVLLEPLFANRRVKRAKASI